MIIKTEKRRLLVLDEVPVVGVGRTDEGDIEFDVRVVVNALEAATRNMTTLRVSLSSGIVKQIVDPNESPVKALKLNFSRRCDAGARRSGHVVFSRNFSIASLSSMSSAQVNENGRGSPKVGVANVSTVLNADGVGDNLVGDVSRRTVDFAALPQMFNDQKLARMQCRMRGIPQTSVVDVQRLCLTPSRTLRGLSDHGARPRLIDESVELLNGIVVGSVGALGESLLSFADDGLRTAIIATEQQTTTSNEFGNGIGKRCSLRMMLPRDAGEQLSCNVEFIEPGTGNVRDNVRFSIDVSSLLNDIEDVWCPPSVTFSLNRDRSAITLMCAPSPNERNSIAGYFVMQRTFSHDDPMPAWKNVGYFESGGHHGRPITTIRLSYPGPAPCCFRVIPCASAERRSSSFSDVEVTAKEGKSWWYEAGVSTVSMNKFGMNQTVSGLPADCASVRFIRRDTNAPGMPTFSSDPVQFDSSATSSASYVHTGLIADHVYEVTAAVTDAHGVEHHVRPVVSTYHPLVVGSIDVNVSGVTTTNAAGSMNVTFNVATSVKDTDADVVLRLLESAGLSRFYDQDVSSQREKLKQLIQAHVLRHDRTNGDVTDLGAIDDQLGNFNDSIASERISAQKLVSSHSYTYEVRCYVRSIDTLFDASTRTSTDPVTKNEYTWSPAKFLHPVSLKKGVITSPAGEKLQHGLSKFKFGDVGAAVYIDVDPMQGTAAAVNVSATSKSISGHRAKAMLRWKTTGSKRFVDHYLVYGISYGSSTPMLLGLACDNGSVSDDAMSTTVSLFGLSGSVRFIIVPVMLDMSNGERGISGDIIVEPTT